MDLRTIKKLSDIVAHIELLDGEIMKLNETAMLISDKNIVGTLKLSFENPLEEKNKKVLDADGDLIDHDAVPEFSVYQSILFPSFSKPKDNKPDNRYHHKEIINEVTMLNILNFLLINKTKEREALLEPLKKYQN